MRRIATLFFVGLLFLSGYLGSQDQSIAAEKKGAYLLLGDVKEGWKVFNEKKCSQCHSIWGEGGKGGPDLGTLPEHYVSQVQLAALLWNHDPEMWGGMTAKKIPFRKIDRKEMADLFAFLYFIRYMDEPGDPQKGMRLIQTKGCIKCHTLKEGGKGDLSRWGMYTNPIMWAEMMWNHTPQMEREMKKSGVSLVEFKGNEMIDLITYIRSFAPTVEKIYLYPGDPGQGERFFVQKGCVQCHTPGGQLDLSKRKDFPRTLAQLSGTMWNHSHKMWREIEVRRMEWPSLSPIVMADLVAYLFSIRYFDEPGDPGRGKTIFTNKQCHVCHGKGKKPNLADLKGQISPIFMAQLMWNHGPGMLEKMRKEKVPWQRFNGEEMADLMEYLNRGTP